MVTEHRLSTLISLSYPGYGVERKYHNTHTHVHGSSLVHVCRHKNRNKRMPSDSSLQSPVLFPTTFISDAQRHPFPLYQNV